MVKSRINKKIIEFIDNTKYDEDIQSFIKDCLDMEFDKVKANSSQYFNDYDKKVEKYVE